MLVVVESHCCCRAMDGNKMERRLLVVVAESLLLPGLVDRDDMERAVPNCWIIAVTTIWSSWVAVATVYHCLIKRSSGCLMLLTSSHCCYCFADDGALATRYRLCRWVIAAAVAVCRTTIRWSTEHCMLLFTLALIWIQHVTLLQPRQHCSYETVIWISFEVCACLQGRRWKITCSKLLYSLQQDYSSFAPVR